MPILLLGWLIGPGAWWRDENETCVCVCARAFGCEWTVNSTHSSSISSSARRSVEPLSSPYMSESQKWLTSWPMTMPGCDPGYRIRSCVVVSFYI